MYFYVKSLFSGIAMTTTTLFIIAVLYVTCKGSCPSYFMKDLVIWDEICTSRRLLVKHLLVWVGFLLHQTACTDPVAS